MNYLGNLLQTRRFPSTQSGLLQGNTFRGQPMGVSPVREMAAEQALFPLTSGSMYQGPTSPPSIGQRVSSGIGGVARGIGGAFTGAGSSARLSALGASLLSGPSRTPISLGSSLAQGLLAGNIAAQQEEDRRFNRSLLELEMAAAKDKLKPSISVKREELSEYLVSQGDGTSKKETLQSITIGDKESLYRSVPKTPNNPMGIEEVSFGDVVPFEREEMPEGMSAQAVKVYGEMEDSRMAVENLSTFQKNVQEGFQGGISSKVTGWSAKAKTLFGVKLNEKEGLIKLLSADQNSQLGKARISIVGPGQMTDKEAERIITVLGGDIESWFANPQILVDAIQKVKQQSLDTFNSKKRIYEALKTGRFPSVQEPVNVFSPSAEPEDFSGLNLG
jgi:hypothetical protein